LARKILLADDSVTAQNMGRKILADAGYEVVAVNNGSAALKKAVEIKPDLVVLDVYMPGYSGLEVCQRLKESHETASIPVLLTVGKLEPFKPEEAQRVRAEAFIVKPFEASELLSALSKLEDKVVPRSETSRLGRFARAFAGAEESGRSRSGEDNGWKNRIAFPHEKTQAEKEAEKKQEEIDAQATTYNQVNRDLRTVVDHDSKTEPPREEFKVAEEKDQPPVLGIPGAHAKSETGEATGREPETVDLSAIATQAPSTLPADVTQEEVAAITAAAAQIQIASGALARERASDASVHPGSTELEPPASEIENSKRTQDSGAPLSLPGAAAQATPSATPASSAFGNEPDGDRSSDLPVTMAAATAESVPGSSGSSRWTAVAVALENEESSLSLEREMQKAYASSLAAESGTNEADVDASAAAISGPTTSAVTNDGSVSAVSLAETPVASSLPAEWAVAELAPLSQSPVVVESSASAENVSPAEPSSTPSPQQSSQSHSTTVGSQAETVCAAPEAEAAPQAIASVQDSGFRQLSPLDPPPETALQQPAEPSATASAGEVAAADPGSAYRIFTPAEESERAQSDAKQDPESVKTAAAAWANWRQIRDNTKSFDGTHEGSEVNVAAAAAAAGAERALPSAPGFEEQEHPADVASIVDSVLADLRPKLMREISRKMSEKK